MSEKSQIKEYICLANISVKGESGVKYVRDELYTEEEVRRSPSGKKNKFAKIESLSPGSIDGTAQELKILVQNQQIKIQTLEAALAESGGSNAGPKKPSGKAITSATGGQAGEEKL